MASIKTNRDLISYFKYLLLHPAELKRFISKLWGRYSLAANPYAVEVAAPAFENTDGTIKNEISMCSCSGHNTDYSYYGMLRLASLPLGTARNERINWDIVYSDGEDVAALHRFAWMFQALIYDLDYQNNLQASNAFFVDTIHGWIDHNMPEGKIEARKGQHYEVWQTYTVVERTLNWIYCLLATSGANIKDKKIETALTRQLIYISQHLEYNGEIFTGNHLSNSGRGLFIGGLVLQNDFFMDLGLNILQNEADRIIVDDLFLREGSTHYQFLVGRNYLEAFIFAAIYHHEKAARTLHPIAERLMGGCKYFMHQNKDGSWDIPLIGDISPDCPPRWLMGVPYVADMVFYGQSSFLPPEAPGWHSLFGKMISLTPWEKGALPKSNQTCTCQDWTKLQYSDWLCYAHVNSKNYLYLLGHTHQDTGGILLYHKGEKIIIDTGRRQYNQENFGSRGKQWYGHSLVCVDDMSPCIESRSMYSEEFLRSQLLNPPSISVSEDGIAIKNYGYMRKNGVGIWERNILFQEKQVIIRDYVDGRSRHKIVMMYHLPYELEPNGHKYCFQVKEHTYSICCSVKSNCVNVLRGSDSYLAKASDQYGKEYDISTLCFNETAELPWECETIIKCEE